MIIYASGFENSYKNINGRNNMSLTFFDVVRSVFSVGYNGMFYGIGHTGVDRFCMLYYLVKSSLGVYLSPTGYYNNIETSEKAVWSYMLGQGLTGLFAERYLNVTNMIHFSKLSQYISGSPILLIGTSNIKSKASPTPGQRPDFYGDIYGHSYHLIESKGRTNVIESGLFERCLRQLSTIHFINGKSPDTRTACAFKFILGKGARLPNITGEVKDPEFGGCENVFYDRKFLIEIPYSNFFSNDLKFDKNYEGFQCFRLNEKLHYGIDQELYKILNESFFSVGGNISAYEVDRVLERISKHLISRSEQYAHLNRLGVSVGKNGTVIVGEDDFDIVTL